MENFETSIGDFSASIIQNSKPGLVKNRNYVIRSKTFSIFGNKNNHKPFLSPGIIDTFLPYVLDESLLTCFLVCPHWLLTIANYLNNKYCVSIDEKFRECYKSYLELEYATVTIQPVLTVGGSVRIDRVLYAKVLKSCVNRTTNLTYNFKYKSTCRGNSEYKKNSPLNYKSPICSIVQPIINRISTETLPIEDTTFISCYEFETNKAGSKRSQWAHKDMSRCHCEEVAVVQTTTTSNLNVGDRIEVAINLSNSFGIINLDSIKFSPLKFEDLKFERCEIEDMYPINIDWRLNNFEDGEINERFNIPNFMPQLEIVSVEYAGTDIITCKVIYKAIGPGELINSKEHLGIDISVVPKEYAIISALKRKGLQHDRYSPLQLRVEDQLILYISKGGAIPT
ncbi:hypothetical protein HWI79_204 [Cryptosporidium felis]|nr:hypothetical protein HWI79_204 [Cryptosporidium felis]